MPQLDPAQLRGTRWYFYRETAPAETEPLLLRADGGIGLHDHPTERFWRVEDGVLCLLDERRDVTLRLEEVVDDGDGTVLRGAHLPDPGIVLCLSQQPPGRPREHLSRTALARQIADFGWSIGAHSYGVPRFLEEGVARFQLGNFCSIAGGVTVSLGERRADIATTFGFASARANWPSLPEVAAGATPGDVVIGHDVWIATDVWIGPGVTIGSGAVIGAKAVVTTSVPPYAIVVGNPGRITRTRFEAAIIAQLLELAWWDLPNETVNALTPLLLSAEIAPLLAALRRIRGRPAPDLGAGPR